MNHRTRTDWNFLWPAVFHCTRGPTRYKHPTKFVLKDIIRHLPGIGKNYSYSRELTYLSIVIVGWVMQLACFLYIKRAWIHDKKKIQALIDYFCGISYKYSLLLFPEGTDFTNSTRENSNKYAERNNLQVMKSFLVFLYKQRMLEIRDIRYF